MRKDQLKRPRCNDPLPLDPYDPGGDPEDSELGLPENYYDPTQYRALVPDPPETMGFG